MEEKKYDWGGTRLNIEQLREVDPMAANDIEDRSVPSKQSKSDRAISDGLLMWLGVWVGGIAVAIFLKFFH